LCSFDRIGVGKLVRGTNGRSSPSLCATGQQGWIAPLVDIEQQAAMGKNIQEIARFCGVAGAAVSRALNRNAPLLPQSHRHPLPFLSDPCPTLSVIAADAGTFGRLAAKEVTTA
jgi:hypothetical protein